MTEFEMRVAGFDELDARTAYLLWQLRESVFVVEQSCPYPELDGRDLEPGTRHVWAEYGGAPVAYLRLLEDHDEARIGRVLVAAGHRGRGLAGRLMEVALDLVGDRPSRLDAQSYLARWYERYGYEQTGPEFLDDGIPHVPMSRPAQSVRTRP
ncbi:MAG TPA: GNAT family N-acetyltransferase [Nocardioidaceae bacterium]|nr:GNAT family N-acetyltransferase [Nocardioidaceae bacterium]